MSELLREEHHDSEYWQFLLSEQIEALQSDVIKYISGHHLLEVLTFILLLLLLVHHLFMSGINAILCVLCAKKIGYV